MRKLDFVIDLCEGLALNVSGEYTEGEPDVGLSSSFEISKLDIGKGSAFDLIEWADAQHGHALTKLDELCIEKAEDILN